MASTDPQPGGRNYRAEMDETEKASRDEITALQTKRLAWSLAHAYGNVAHYKKAFAEAGVHPSDFKQLSDLAKFPFTAKSDLRDNYPFNMFAVPRGASGPSRPTTSRYRPWCIRRRSACRWCRKRRAPEPVFRAAPQTY